MLFKVFSFYKMKILIFIIASDELEIYKEEQKVWRKYMHSHKDITSFFIKGKSSCDALQDELHFDTEENLKPGIINKTIMALKKIDCSAYDYIIRTNLSSFFVFENLIKFLDNKPRRNFYCGKTGQEPLYKWVSGAGIIISNDVANILIDNYNDLYDNKELPDDVLIGKVLSKYDITVTEAPRTDILYINNINDLYNDIENFYNNNTIFHYRIKQIYYTPENRLSSELFILNLLYDKYNLKNKIIEMDTR